ncbi:MAG: deoxyribonuclease V [Proteobacteria bacterium]|nr:deoxyribonuclease V [Pseudomonadota bacterium]
MPSLTFPVFDVPSNGTEARAIQNALRTQVRIEDAFKKIDIIAGVDVGYDTKRGLAHASIVTMHIADLKPLEQVEAYVPVDFPYISGLLSFREIPAILAAISKLKSVPDLLMVDGMGIAHPRRLGIAAHLGVILDMPSMGVGKSRLIGQFEQPGKEKGSYTPLMIGSEQVGVVLRSRDSVKPLFISPGHRVSIETALALTLRSLTRYRLPEPTRLADKCSKCTH